MKKAKPTPAATHYEFQPKGAHLNMRLPESLLEAVKKTAAARGIPYQPFIRLVLEEATRGQRR
jgi:predicted DNA binding CopG/RHH family protein